MKFLCFLVNGTINHPNAVVNQGFSRLPISYDKYDYSAIRYGFLFYAVLRTHKLSPEGFACRFLIRS